MTTAADDLLLQKTPWLAVASICVIRAVVRHGRHGPVKLGKVVECDRNLRPYIAVCEEDVDCGHKVAGARRPGTAETVMIFWNRTICSC